MLHPVNQPLSFTPYLRPQPWGEQRFASILNRPLPAAGRFGESWELSGHALHTSRVADGPLAGQLISQLWADHRHEWCGEETQADFPWLVKFLDCHEFLSVQVHPCNEIARQLTAGECGKTEAWVILAAEPTARVYAGFKDGATIGEVTERLSDGTLADCLHSFTPQPGDCIFIPAGTVHAVGGGVLMVEVQQSSDATFRLFDWNRVGLDGLPRTLHIEESLAAIDWAAGPINPVIPRPWIGDEGDFSGELLVDCPYFHWKRFQLADSPATLVARALSVWILIDGEAILTADGYEKRIRRGDTLLVPPTGFPLTWTPLQPTTLLRIDMAETQATDVRSGRQYEATVNIVNH